MQNMLEACKDASHNDAHLTWVDESFLLEAGAAPWSQIPLWLPGDEYIGHQTINCQKALGAGLTLRPLIQTARDTLEWSLQRPADTRWEAGLTREDESRFLQAWHQHQQK
jgi:2'-hydroxyisoflavone reductase